MNTLISRGIIFASLAASGIGQAHAAGGDWQYLIEPYLMFPNMRGETGIGQLPRAEVDEDPGDIFENLQMGAMLYAEMHNDRWAISSDVIYMDLEADLNQRVLINSGTSSARQLGWELAVMARLNSWFELGLTATYNKIEADLDIDVVAPGGATTTINFGTSESWVDPTIVARAQWPLGEKWFLAARGNIGGFGVGSDLFWQLQADVGYRISEKTQFSFGYRVIDTDYDQGRGDDRFVYNMQNFGPVLKFGFTF